MLNVQRSTFNGESGEANQPEGTLPSPFLT
jgi:hypothetical protein